MTQDTLFDSSKPARRAGMGSHQSHDMGKDEWLTPPEIIRALGTFDLDPCAPLKSKRPWDTAISHFTIDDDGLSKKWHGRVWLNPPYGDQTERWLEKLANHGNGIALIFARTETATWRRQIWGRADAILFIQGRLHFYHASGVKAKHNAGAPSALIAYGCSNVAALERCGITGVLVPRWQKIGKEHANHWA